MTQLQLRDGGLERERAQHSLGLGMGTGVRRVLGMVHMATRATCILCLRTSLAWCLSV